MSSAENQQHTFPTVPPSHSAGDYEMRDYYAPQDALRPFLSQASDHTAYLDLRARLSQIWINRWTVLLLLVLVRTLIAVGDLNDNLDSARREALSACTNVEGIGSTMASMPHYMSQGVNELTANGVESAVNGLMSMLSLTVTGVEEIVVFIINALTSTYLCLITLVITGSLHAGTELVAQAAQALNDTISGIGDDFASVASSFQDQFNSFLDLLNGLPVVGKDPPTLDLNSQIDTLKNLSFPSTEVITDLQTLDNNIPSFDEVQSFLDEFIRAPFELIKGLINDTIDGYTLDRTLLPVPQKEILTFCSDNNGINDFFDGLVDLEKTARKIFIGVIVTLAIIVMIPMAWREIKRWRKMQERSQLIVKEASDPMDVVYLASRPYTSGFGVAVSNRFSNHRHKVAIRWAVAYATSVPALFVLSLGLAGLFACLCQYALLKSLEKEAPALASEVGAFADKVVSALNNASESWANGTNAAILTTNDKINSDVFGWVNTSTSAINDTLNMFLTNVTSVLNDTFGGTVFQDPVLGIFNCIVGIKVEGFEKALTWVSDHAHIDFPLLDNNTFSLGALASVTDTTSDDNFLASPDSATADAITGIVTSLVNKLAEGIRQEAIISTMIVVVWLIICLIGIIRALILIFSPGKTRAEGGQAYVVDPHTDNMRGHDLHEGAAPPTYAAAAQPYVNKAAPYTIQPRPFPTFEPQNRDAARNVDTDEIHEEKISRVNAAHPISDAVARPNHLRASSHGTVTYGHSPSPMDEKANHNNPFRDPEF